MPFLKPPIVDRLGAFLRFVLTVKELLTAHGLTVTFQRRRQTVFLRTFVLLREVGLSPPELNVTTSPGSFYSDVRGDKNVQCSEADKQLQKAVSSMSGFFYNLFFRLGEDNATMLRPTVIDGLPKI
jgi:hypothetical protein